MWSVLISLHLIGLVGFNLVLRHSVVSKVDKFTLATVMQTGIALPALILLILFPPDIRLFTGGTYILLLLAIVFTIGLQLTNTKALQYLEAGVYSILYNLRIIITTGLGILLLDEEVVWLRIAGGLLIFFAIFIVKQRSEHANRLVGVLWGIVAALVLSFLNTFEKLLINDIGFINYFPLVSVIAGLIMWSYYLLKHKKFNHGILLNPNMIKLMVLRALSAYGFSGALGVGGLVSVGNYISGMSVIVTVVLGALLLGERDHLARKIIAAVVTIVGLTLVLIASISQT